MRRLLPLIFTLSALGCSSDPPADAGGGGAAGTTTTGGSAGTNTGGNAGSGMGGSVTGGSGGAGSSSGGSGGGGTSGWTKTGSCRQGGKAVAMGSATYEGIEEFYILTEEALDNGEITTDPANVVCHIRFNVARSGEGATGCVDLDGMPCEWSQEVAFSNPETLVDVNGACATSFAAWDSAWEATIDGTRASYGYVDMYEGHNSVVMRHTSEASGWQMLGGAFWDPMTGELDYTNVLSPDCQY